MQQVVEAFLTLQGLTGCVRVQRLVHQVHVFDKELSLQLPILLILIWIRGCSNLRLPRLNYRSVASYPPRRLRIPGRL